MREEVKEETTQSVHIGKAKQGQLASTHGSSRTSPPSSSSSPTHEFSFTISLHPPPPADDIFFHGHLLPLRLLSHFPLSSSPSTNSLDSFTLPIREDQNPTKKGHNNNNYTTSETKGRAKSKSYALFGKLPKRPKGFEVGQNSEDQEKPKRRLKLDLTHALKRYVKMVRPLLSFRWRREKIRLRRQPFSLSGNLMSSRGGNKPEVVRGKRGGLSAPASMRTSPTNSGCLNITETALASNSSVSTMEELQAAIQAAIAHCKNSIAMEERVKC